jgi:putative ABC transport system permease protein
MIKFLLKGLIRDRSRSLFPILTVVAGVMLTVILYSWVKGTQTDLIRANANFNTGHVKIMSFAYSQESDQIPNDLAYTGVADLLTELRNNRPEMIWTPRIRFGGLLDIPDQFGETISQAPVAGLAVDLLSSQTPETEILNLKEALVRGKLPAKRGEVLISEELSRKLGVKIGDTATLVSSTMYGSLSTYNFIISGTIRFGISAMDRGAMLTDISDIQRALDMNDTAGEIVGYFRDDIYRNNTASIIAEEFNSKNAGEDEFRPVMVTLRNQAGLAQTLDLSAYISAVLIGLFVIVMSIVLWNAGLMASLRRYGEIGVRLAIGENKGHIYRSMIAESLMVGFFGSVLGTAIGVAISYYLQVHGIDISSMLKNASMMISDVMKAQVTPVSFFIGFIPGLLATLLGTSISGIGIYQRQTSQLAKELEA